MAKNLNIFLIGAGFSKYFFNLPITNELVHIMNLNIEDTMKKITKYDSVSFDVLDIDNLNNLYVYYDQKTQEDIIIHLILFIFISILLKENFKNVKNLSTKEKNFIDEFYRYIEEVLCDRTLLYAIKFTLISINNNDEEEIWSGFADLLHKFNNSNILNSFFNVFKKIFKINFSDLSSLISFEEWDLNNIKSMDIYLQKNEYIQIIRMSLYLFLKNIFNNNNFDSDEKKREFNTFINNISESLLIDFNWDKTIINHSKEKIYNLDLDNTKIISNNNLIYYCKIHNSIDDFNIISPTFIRQKIDIEIEKMERYIRCYLNNFPNLQKDNHKIYCYLIGISLEKYDEIFIYKLNSLFKNHNIHFVLFKINKDKDNKNTIDSVINHKPIGLLMPEVVIWNTFDDINKIIKKNNER